MNRRIRLLTFDAFGTLFTPRESIGKQYLELARRHGLNTLDCDIKIENSFRNAIRKESKEHPNYGQAVGWSASDWWAAIIRSTFRPLLSPATPLPESLIKNLLRRFATAEGYKLFEDVLPMFQRIRALRQSVIKSSLLSSELEIGIITNSDDRVLSVLSDLGLHVRHRRYGISTRALDFEDSSYVDINFVVISYDVGLEKPDRRIFDIARQLCSKGQSIEPYECLHVGDHIQQDFLGAQAAGWNGLLLSRHQHAVGNRGVKDLLSLAQIFEHLG